MLLIEPMPLVVCKSASCSFMTPRLIVCRPPCSLQRPQGRRRRVQAPPEGQRLLLSEVREWPLPELSESQFVVSAGAATRIRGFAPDEVHVTPGVSPSFPRMAYKPCLDATLYCAGARSGTRRSCLPCGTLRRRSVSARKTDFAPTTRLGTSCLRRI